MEQEDTNKISLHRVFTYMVKSGVSAMFLFQSTNLTGLTNLFERMDVTEKKLNSNG